MFAGTVGKVPGREGFAGAGSNIVFVDAANDLVVLRWIDNKALDQVLQAITGALIKS